jgi:N-acetylglucosaminyl-diphospho-decaprenol L-rhamnosyltransferase
VSAEALDLSVVVVSYNVGTYLAECLASLPAGCEGLSSECLVVDNASADASADLVARRFPQVVLFRNEVNVGFSRAVNRALEQARGRYAVLLNPDTIVPPGALTRLVAVADRWPEVGLVAPELRDPATARRQASFRRFPTWRAAFSHYTLAKAVLRLLPRPAWSPVADRPTTAGWLVGACLLIRRELLQAVGGLDGQYFLWFEDIEYCRRAIRAGWPVLYTREAHVLHHESRSVAQEAPVEMRLVELAGLFRYLASEEDGAPSWRRPLFKALVVLTAIGRVGVSGAKATLYVFIGRGDRATVHRRRVAAERTFLAHIGRFLAL